MGVPLVLGRALRRTSKQLFSSPELGAASQSQGRNSHKATNSYLKILKLTPMVLCPRISEGGEAFYFKRSFSAARVFRN